jgi:8-oxo-dGTP diphosphatase
MDQNRPRIGVGVVVSDKGRILLGKRLNSHGEGQWALPGGHLEFGETVEFCAARELLEETNLVATDLRKGPWVSNVIEGKHYITFFVFADSFTGNLSVLEPEKCAGWTWFSPKELPTPLFAPVESLYRENFLDTHSLLKKIVAFHTERDWGKFHSPKNLAMDLACETGELLEPFRWLTEEQSYNLDPKTLENVKDEIGDVLKIILYLADKLGIDPLKSTDEKLDKMEKKYPAELCRGVSLKYTAYENLEK